MMCQLWLAFLNQEFGVSLLLKALSWMRKLPLCLEEDVSHGLEMERSFHLAG